MVLNPETGVRAHRSIYTVARFGIFNPLCNVVGRMPKPTIEFVFVDPGELGPLGVIFQVTDPEILFLPC